MRDALSDRSIQLYLLGLVVLGATSIGSMYALFTSGFPAFADAFTDSPGQAVQNDPLFLVFLFAVFVLIFLLVALVVLFGATYALDEEEVESSSEAPSGSITESNSHSSSESDSL